MQVCRPALGNEVIEFGARLLSETARNTSVVEVEVSPEAPHDEVVFGEGTPSKRFNDSFDENVSERPLWRSVSIRAALETHWRSCKESSTVPRPKKSLKEVFNSCTRVSMTI